jgi:transposase
VDSFNKKLKYHQIDSIDYLEKESKDKINFYQVNASLSENMNAIKIAYQSAGRFILATNILDEKSLSNDDMLSEYKAQQSCERGFGFLKDPLFFASLYFS